MSIFIGDIEPDYSDNSSTSLYVQFNHSSHGYLRAEDNQESTIKDYSDWEVLSIVAIIAIPFIIGGWCFCRGGNAAVPPSGESHHMPRDTINSYGAIPPSGESHHMPRDLINSYGDIPPSRESHYMSRDVFTGFTVKGNPWFLV